MSIANNDKCKNLGSVKNLFLISMGDMAFDFEKGTARMKRKYGKFTRPVRKYVIGEDSEEKPIEMKIFKPRYLNPNN